MGEEGGVKSRSAIIGILAALTVAGCALLSEPAPEKTPEKIPEKMPEAAAPRQNFHRESEEILALLSYYQGLLAMPAEDLRKEYMGVSQAFARDKSEFGRLKLALLMNVPGAAWHDDAKLLALLEGAPSRPAASESPRRQFALLLQKLAAERLREQRRGDELQQKLDALLEIERSLRGRQANKP